MDALREELRKEMQEEMAAMWERMRTEMESLQGNVGEKSSNRDPPTTIETLKSPKESVTLEIKVRKCFIIYALKFMELQ